MATILDDFNRANGGLGTNWTTLASNTAPSISSNTAINPLGAGGGGCGALWTADSFSGDAFCQLSASVGSSYCNVAVLICFNDAGTDGYWFYWENNGGTGNYVLQEVITGSGVNLASAAGVGITGTRTLRIERRGNVIVAFVNSVEIVRATDATRLSGRAGFSPYFDSGTTPTVDNFAAGTTTDTLQVVRSSLRLR